MCVEGVNNSVIVSYMNEKSIVILVIEDETSVRESLVDYLEDCNYKVLQAENGAVGLDIFRQQHPDVILTDLRMPELDGLSVLSQVRDQSPEIPLIVVSGTGDIGDSVEALRSGAWDYIIKPIDDMSIVLLAIDRVMERVRLLEENRAHQEDLEQLVHDRTEALQQVNTQLSDINGRLRGIITSTGELAKCSDVSHFGTTLLDEFAGHMAATGGSLFFIEKEGLRLLRTKEPDRVPMFIPFPLRDGSILQRVIQEEKPLLVKDINRDGQLKASGWNGYKNDSLLAFPLPDESGHIVGILTLHNKTHPPFIEQDLEIGSILASFSRETLRAVQHSETIRMNADQQQTILNSLQTGIVVIDPENHTIVDVNSEAARLIKAPKEEIIGRACHRFICSAEEGDCPLTDFDERLDYSEKEVITSDSQKIPVLKTAVRIELKGRTHFLESFVDISKNKEIEQEKLKLEAQLIQAQKMEAIGTLAGGVAHDLNNALNGILSPVSILLHQVEKDQPISADKLEKQFKRIQHSGYRIADMVSQLMAVSYKQELSLTAVDLHQSIKHVLKLANGTFDKSIEIVHVDSGSSASTMADPARVEQSLLNIVINAEHAMTTMRKEGEKWGGRLEVDVRKICADNAFRSVYSDIAEGEYWLISIQDSGVGMTPDEMTQIFTPFYTSKQKGQGTGLGLSMAFNIVKQHNGTITVDSIKGAGTTFNIYLPRTKVTKAGDIQEVNHELLQGSGLVLLVDDEENIRDTTQEILAEFGYKTIMAEDGMMAVDLFKKQGADIDLVLLDLIMPKMSGDEAYRLIREMDADVPILLVSGFKQDHRIQSVLKNNDTEFLQKPYDLYSLGIAVKKSIKGTP